jgi:hypothetical protein
MASAGPVLGSKLGLGHWVQDPYSRNELSVLATGRDHRRSIAGDRSRAAPEQAVSLIREDASPLGHPLLDRDALDDLLATDERRARVLDQLD